MPSVLVGRIDKCLVSRTHEVVYGAIMAHLKAGLTRAVISNVSHATQRVQAAIGDVTNVDEAIQVRKKRHYLQTPI